MELGRRCRHLFQGSLQASTKRNWSKARQIADRLDDDIIDPWTGYLWNEFIRLALDFNVLFFFGGGVTTFRNTTYCLDDFMGKSASIISVRRHPPPSQVIIVCVQEREAAAYWFACPVLVPYRLNVTPSVRIELCVCVPVQVKLTLWMKATIMGRGSTVPRIYRSSLRRSWVVSTSPKMLILRGELNTGLTGYEGWQKKR